jgi:RHS repeat-associated protein
VPDGHSIEQIDGSGNPSYYLYDQLVNVKGLLNQARTVTASYVYDPYGARTAVTGSTSAISFGFAGEYTDPETGFQYLQARYYDPATGQFLSRDPLADLTGQTYAYAGANLLTWTDPAGFGSPLGQSYFGAVIPGCQGGNADVQCAREKVNVTKAELAAVANSGVARGAGPAGHNQLAAMQYIGQHPEALKRMSPLRAECYGTFCVLMPNFQLAESMIQSAEPIVQAINCGDYGYAAGYGAVTFGPSVVGGAMGLPEDAAVAATDGAALWDVAGCAPRVADTMPRGSIIGPVDRPVIIGEGMQDRVIPYSKKIGAEVYQGAPKGTAPDQWMEHNRAWIHEQMAQGRQIIDIRPHPTRVGYPGPSSPYYAMERNAISASGYLNYVQPMLDEPWNFLVSSAH